jgi:hypothetical protein
VITWISSCSQTAFNQRSANMFESNVRLKLIENASPASTQLAPWIPSAYRTIVPGRSTYRDIKRVFGKPRWEGQNEDKTFENDAEFELLLQYAYQGPGKEAADVIIGEKTKLVKAITYIPNPQLTKQEAIATFGTNYFEIASSDPLCIRADAMRGPGSESRFPRLLVYPEKGMYVSIREDNSVIQVGFSYKCR